MSSGGAALPWASPCSALWPGPWPRARGLCPAGSPPCTERPHADPSPPPQEAAPERGWKTGDGSPSTRWGCCPFCLCHDGAAPLPPASGEGPRHGHPGSCCRQPRTSTVGGGVCGCPPLNSPSVPGKLGSQVPKGARNAHPKSLPDGCHGHTLPAVGLLTMGTGCHLPGAETAEQKDEPLPPPANWRPGPGRWREPSPRPPRPPRPHGLGPTHLDRESRRVRQEGRARGKGGHVERRRRGLLDDAVPGPDHLAGGGAPQAAQAGGCRENPVWRSAGAGRDARHPSLQPPPQGTGVSPDGGLWGAEGRRRRGADRRPSASGPHARPGRPPPPGAPAGSQGVARAAPPPCAHADPRAPLLSRHFALPSSSSHPNCSVPATGTRFARVAAYVMAGTFSTASRIASYRPTPTAHSSDCPDHPS